MRIISGFLKGKKINFLKNLVTRPIKDIVKESIFNILEHSNLINTKIKKSKVLDLYSGIGSFGLECISRGAQIVTFVESDIYASNVLKKNLTKLSIIEKAKIFQSKIENFLDKDLDEKYDIIFLDPPFSDRDFIKNLETIKNKILYEKDHIIIIHRERKNKDDFKKLVKIIDKKIYGRSEIIFCNFT